MPTMNEHRPAMRKWWTLPLLASEPPRPEQAYSGKRLSEAVADIQSLLRHTGIRRVVVEPQRVILVWDTE